MDEDDVEIFSLSIPKLIDTNDDSSSSSSYDSDIEVTSTIDKEENELVQLGNDLCLNSIDSSDDDMDIQDNSTIQSFPEVRTSEADENNGVNFAIDNSSSTTSSPRPEASTTPSQKRKRRAWSVKEKLQAIENYEKSNSKHSAAKEIGCTRYQLREWLKSKEELKKLQSMDNGGRRKRLKGGGKKLKYVDLDDRLIKWFKERRTPPTSDATVINIRREKISFKQLVRQGTILSAELNHVAPSVKWYQRFMIRNRLSLQRPKRNQKISLPEAHKQATLFYNYLRRASTWGPTRGPMGAFKPSDRFATVILTIFPERNDRIGPILLFKGKGRVSDKEVRQYAKQVKVKDGNPKLLITDSCHSHLNPQTKQSLRQKSVVIAVIPKGCTQYLQILDTLVFSTFKSHYFDAAQEFIEKNGPRSQLKLNAAQSRIMCTRFTWEAWKRTLKSIDIKKGFTEIGYIWTNNAIVSPRTLPGYVYDPNQEYQSQSHGDDDIENRIANDANLANQEHTQMMVKNGGKQLKLIDLWKKN
ncbi:unnamed protein product [Rotaria sp. Silwood1]|nr:unnamed protein product [Rotaria sp. Silwood1]CAF3772154.1 unnamed protein product [Rotaria sp. Silwood1]CAF4572423.1 unnamed protein product [Rotaria sp. Silwood1]CAF4696521.1 unnamed protein product [Rotaria sp. Silwood1]CAF4947841.1 unnamed protein product [Rotaria sp. Silwood1]